MYRITEREFSMDFNDLLTALDHARLIAKAHRAPVAVFGDYGNGFEGIAVITYERHGSETHVPPIERILSR